MAERGKEAPDWVAPARAERRRHRCEAMEFRRRREAARDAYLQAQLEPAETIFARGPQALVTDRRILFAWRLPWPPREGEWAHDALTFDEIARWTLGRRHDHRPLLKLEHPPHVRIEWVPAHGFLWFVWGNASGGVSHVETKSAWRVSAPG